MPREQTDARRDEDAPTPLSLFQIGRPPDEGLDEEAEAEEEAPELGGVRCPLCLWRPRAHDLWECGDCDWPEYFYDSCGALWNTFETRGRCPGCGHQWRWTTCLNCWRWSLHEDWYAPGG